MAIIKVKTGGITADAITSTEIADNAVVTAAINADAVTDAKIADDVVGTEHLTANEVDTTALGADAVTGAQLADNAVNSEHYTDGSIDTAHIADAQITTAKLATAVLTGATDIGAAIADADLFLVDDGAGGTLRKSAASRIKTYVGEGLFTKITGTTISAGGGVTIQNCFNSTFRNYFITFERIKCATDGANLELDPIDTNGNQTDEHCYQGLFMGKAQFSNNWSEDNGASYTLMENQGNATGEHFSGFLYAFNPNQAGSSEFSVTWQGFNHHNGAAGRNGVTWGGGKTATNTSAYTGFILRMTSGNINSGTVAVYGINDPT